ncbi:MAG: hypothetical protein V1903_14310 [Bacteroidota bacterium]
MNEISTFTSRPARITCPAREFFDFVSDARNFEQFISAETFSDLKADMDSLSFQASMLGSVSLRISEKIMYSNVIYRGENQQVKDFMLKADIADSGPGSCEVTLTLQAELNPMLRMFAAAPAAKFLDALASQMEKYRGWNKPRS